MRTYEMILVVDPRVSDDEFVALADDYKKMITAGGAEVIHQENWGRRRLAYPIEKLQEAKYMFLAVRVDDKNPLSEVEHRLRQNDKVLRYLTVRVDDRLTMTAPAPVPTPGDRDRDRDRDRGDRGDRGGRGRDRGDRGDRGDRPERGDRGDRPGLPAPASAVAGPVADEPVADVAAEVGEG